MLVSTTTLFVPPERSILPYNNDDHNGEDLARHAKVTVESTSNRRTATTLGLGPRAPTPPERSHVLSNTYIDSMHSNNLQRWTYGCRPHGDGISYTATVLLRIVEVVRVLMSGIDWVCDQKSLHDYDCQLGTHYHYGLCLL